MVVGVKPLVAQEVGSSQSLVDHGVTGSRSDGHNLRASLYGAMSSAGSPLCQLASVSATDVSSKQGAAASHRRRTNSTSYERVYGLVQGTATKTSSGRSAAPAVVCIHRTVHEQ